MSPKMSLNVPTIELSKEAREGLSEAIAAERAKLTPAQGTQYWQTSVIREKLLQFLEQVLNDLDLTSNTEVMILEFSNGKNYVLRSVLLPEQLDTLSDAASERWLRKIARQWTFIAAWIDLEREEDLPAIGAK